MPSGAGGDRADLAVEKPLLPPVAGAGVGKDLLPVSGGGLLEGGLVLVDHGRGSGRGARKVEDLPDRADGDGDAIAVGNTVEERTLIDSRGMEIDRRAIDARQAEGFAGRHIIAEHFDVLAAFAEAVVHFVGRHHERAGAQDFAEAGERTVAC